MTENEKNQLEFYKCFYYLMWGSGWVSTDITYDYSRKAEYISGFNSDGEVSKFDEEPDYEVIDKEETK